jgi:hypothetical protein
LWQDDGDGCSENTMSRYTCLLTLGNPLEDLQQTLLDAIKGCGYDIIYQTDDYFMAREIPGNVTFAKLVTIEALIDRTMATETTVRIKMVIKNEELPLALENHCKLQFEVISKAITSNPKLQLIESVLG